MEVRTAKCPNCGAEFLIEDEKETTVCDYCHATVDFNADIDKEAFEPEPEPAAEDAPAEDAEEEVDPKVAKWEKQRDIWMYGFIIMLILCVLDITIIKYIFGYWTILGSLYIYLIAKPKELQKKDLEARKARKQARKKSKLLK